jgi:molybdopterin molybdotransferase
MTGAPVPPEADTIVPIEETTSNGVRIEIRRSFKPGYALARRGSDLMAGSVILPRGSFIRPAQVGALVQVGAIDVLPETLFRSSSALGAHVLVTGDEIVGERESPGPLQMRDVNGPMLTALLTSMGVSCDRSRVIDDPAQTRDAIDTLSRSHHILFVTGGMSMGKYDYVPGALLELGFDLKITKLRVKPGKPFVFAVRERVGKTDFVFGLPGNPVAGFCCTLRLASRLVARLQRRVPCEPVLAPLAEPLGPNGPREFYQPAVVASAGVTPLGWEGSADVFTLAHANALLIRPTDDPARPVGDRARVLMI